MSVLDSLNWGTYWDTSASGGVLYYSIDDGTYGGEGFLPYEQDAIRNAVEAWSNVCGIEFSEVSPTYPSSQFSEEITFVAVDSATMEALTGTDGVLGFHDTPGSVGTLYQYGLANAPGLLAGVYNYEGLGFTEIGLQQGGYGFITLIHELGHGLGFAHPHDQGGTSSVMDGVGSAFGDYGDYDLNQGINTIMSYNDGWPTEFPNHAELGYGYAGGPMALDIALAQELYGINTSHANGNSTYILPTVNEAGTFWTCIWDTGGSDKISNEDSNQSCTINLNAATLVGASAGGYVSWVEGIVGGFTIANGVGIETAVGGAGWDNLIGNDLSNTLIGNKGNDKLYGDKGNDKLYGGKGNDKSYGQAGNDSLYMDAGNDTLDGGSGTDWLYVTGSTNSVVNLGKTTAQNTGYGTDIIKNIENASGGKGADKFYGTTGNNVLKGNNGNDILQGKNGNDKLYGGNNNDKLYGGNNNDKLYGGNNNDKLYGGKGNDFLKGEAGRDALQGDAGKDTMFGGAGADTFVFKKTSDSKAAASKADVIKDFEQGVDVIDLSAIDASANLSGNNAFTFDGTQSFGNGNEGEIYYQQFDKNGTDNDYTMVYIDTDNDSGTEMSIKLMGLHDLTADDFIL